LRDLCAGDFTLRHLIETGSGAGDQVLCCNVGNSAGYISSALITVPYNHHILQLLL